MQHTPATSGTTETITVLVGNSTPTVTVDGRAATLNASHQLTMDVAPGSQHEIRLEYPAAGQQASETFNLNFQFDLPKESGFTVNPPSDAYKAYLTNTANDAPFRRSQAPSGTSSSRGAQALRDWINSLPDPKTVQLDAHASWEGFTDTAHSQYNLSLSNRRLQVAMGIIGEHAHVSASGFTGDSDAQTAGRRSTAGGTADNPDRVVHIKGLTGAAPSATVVTGRISRPADPARPSTPTTPATPSTPTTPKTPTTPATPSTPAKPSTPATPAQPAGSGQIAGNPAISFKLKFVHQEELKTMTFEYNRSDATQRSYAPQGFFGLMLADLKDEEKSFLEVDLDDPFFREFAVTVQAPIDFQKIGLRSAHVSLDYGDPNDAQNFKHGDAIFDPTQPNEYKFAVFMDANHDTGYSYSTEYHFDPESGWDGNSFSYQFQPRQTEDRTLFLNPYDQIGFLEVQVFPHQVDPGVMDSIDVNLSHTDPDGQVVRRTLNVTPGSQPQFWRVRLADPQAHTYTCQLTHHLKDGTQIKADPVDSTATALPVNDPFDKAIEIDFVPVFNSATTRLVFIDVTYDDDKNNYHRQERLELQPNNQNPTHLRIALMDPARTTFSYRITIVGTAGQMNQGKFIETGETLIPVSAPATDAP